MKNSSHSDSEEGRTGNNRQTSLRNGGSRPPISTPDDKTMTTIGTAQSYQDPSANIAMTNSGVWSWLSRRSTPQTQLNAPTTPAENHYTHMEENYNGVGEALYAELDRESTADSPAYQNSAYTDPDAPVSSAPSSAYYSDLSVTTVPERAYEVVGLSTLPVWENNGDAARRTVPPRLASISETVSVPSDYV
ncbi:PREDICTED: uncharacterized protein LOC108565475 [Nicrophorus vespilloides]|uniref:Uncharacterized protein LOC108565475 n=1 Tax=Nicrophorus vespilloides TaxID=110193 RepID=A0ABM1N0V8_NICVS|nr:PREDICTED: uncharacterized protein LOC108565475 [Nicrophorus vespilloides]